MSASKDSSTTSSQMETTEGASSRPQGPGPWGWFGGSHPGANAGEQTGEGGNRWAQWQQIMEQRRKDNCKCEKNDAESDETVKCSCPPGPRGGQRGGNRDGPPPYWLMMMMMGMRGKGGPGQGGPGQGGPPGGVDNDGGPPPEFFQNMMMGGGGGGGWFSGIKNMFGYGRAPEGVHVDHVHSPPPSDEVH